MQYRNPITLWQTSYCACAFPWDDWWFLMGSRKLKEWWPSGLAPFEVQSFHFLFFEGAHARWYQVPRKKPCPRNTLLQGHSWKPLYWSQRANHMASVSSLFFWVVKSCRHIHGMEMHRCFQPLPERSWSSGICFLKTKIEGWKNWIHKMDQHASKWTHWLEHQYVILSLQRIHINIGARILSLCKGRTTPVPSKHYTVCLLVFHSLEGLSTSATLKLTKELVLCGRREWSSIG